MRPIIEKSSQPSTFEDDSVDEHIFRLGDLIDDFCPRCKLLLNHAVASMVDGKVVKVICQTCYTEHAYLHGKGAKKKPSGGRTTLFDQVLAKATPVESAAVSPRKKKAAAPARYISRHKTRPPRSGR